LHCGADKKTECTSNGSLDAQWHPWVHGMKCIQNVRSHWARGFFIMISICFNRLCFVLSYRSALLCSVFHPSLLLLNSASASASASIFHKHCICISLCFNSYGLLANCTCYFQLPLVLPLLQLRFYLTPLTLTLACLTVRSH